MISDEPDEDADTLDDEAALSTYLGDTKSPPHIIAHRSPPLENWPSKAMQNIDLNMETGTLIWFQASHVDWQRAMRRVLRAWVDAHASQRLTPPPLSPEGRPDVGLPESA